MSDAIEAGGAAQERSGADAASQSVGRVLFVEDDDEIRDVIVQALCEEGYDARGAPHGRAALDVLERWPAQVILLDLWMPVMSGAEFAAEYRRRPGPHAPMIVISAAADGLGVLDAIQPDGVLRKPFDLFDLLELIERHVSPPAG